MLASLFALAGCAVDAVSKPTGLELAAARAANLGDAQLVGQRIVTGFQGERPPAALRRRIRAGRIAGVILFADNFDSRGEAERLVRRLQRIRRPDGLDDPLLIMVDQEGGLVKRLPGPPSLSAEQMGVRGKRTCRRQGAKTGRMLRRTQINVNLAPVLDVARPGSAMENEDRSFGRDPDLVAACGDAFASALDRRGVAPSAKHFPGLGAARLNTDDAVQRIEVSRRKLRRVDERPYRRFIADGSADRLVMLSSAVYPAFSKRPAAFNAKLATRELRDRLGFAGVSMTDALETASTAAIGGPTRAARLAAGAGTDLLLFGSFDAARRVVKPLRRLARSERERFRASVARVLALRQGLPQH